MQFHGLAIVREFDANGSGENNEALVSREAVFEGHRIAAPDHRRVRRARLGPPAQPFGLPDRASVRRDAWFPSLAADGGPPNLLDGGHGFLRCCELGRWRV